MLSKQPKVALVHDDFCQLGGAERLFAEIAKIYPEAPIYTSLVNWSKIPTSINPDRIHTSFIQQIPFATKFYKLLLPLYPFAFESFDLSEFDLVISSTTRFAKAMITKPNTVHISYVNSIPRFLYNQDQAGEYLPHLLKFMLKPYFKWLKRWDKAASSRPDLYIVNSQNVARQIKKVYGRESEVIYPAVDTNWFKVKSSQLTAKEKTVNRQPLTNYYLVVSRLVKWKKIDIAIQATQELGVSLKIVGIGPDEQRLRELFSPKSHPEFNSGSEKKILKRVPFKKFQGKQNDKKGIVEFVGSVDRKKLRDLYQNAKALIVTQEEDFGIAIIEAQSCGIPVIAYKAGGALEIIKEGKTGIFFKNQSPEAVKDAISIQSKLKWDISACRENALRFSKAVFVNSFKKSINDYAAKNH